MPYRGTVQAQRAVQSLSSPDSRWLGRGCNSAARVGVRLPERRICLCFPVVVPLWTDGLVREAWSLSLLSLSCRLTCIPGDEHQIIRIPSPAVARHPAWAQQAIERGGHEKEEEGFRPSSSSAAPANQGPRLPLLFSRINEFIPRPIYSSLSGPAPVKQAIKKKPSNCAERRAHRQTRTGPSWDGNGRTTSPSPGPKHVYATVEIRH